MAEALASCRHCGSMESRPFHPQAVPPAERSGVLINAQNYMRFSKMQVDARLCSAVRKQAAFNKSSKNGS